MTTNLATSTGHDLADADWLDQHFNFSREAYEAMVRWVGFQPGWHVLDAGCGSGSFLPLLAAQVGATGKVSALDLAPENIAAVEARIKSKPLACPVEARVGSVLALPYPDHTFDAVWNANVSQYLTDDELRQMLAEFKRVTKPSGVVAIKEYTDQYWQDSVLNCAFGRWIDAMVRMGDLSMIGRLRATDLPRYAREAALRDIRHKYFTIGKQGPMNSNDQAFLTNAIVYYASYADRLEISAKDVALWHRLAEPQAALDHVSSPDFYFRIAYIQVVGRVP